jgi:DNA-binding transcriptional LysR family regulator
MDKFDCIRTFVRVAKSGNLTNAATQLAISRSMVTKQLKHLEDQLGVRLLHRTTRTESHRHRPDLSHSLRAIAR